MTARRRSTSPRTLRAAAGGVVLAAVSYLVVPAAPTVAAQSCGVLEPNCTTTTTAPAATTTTEPDTTTTAPVDPPPATTPPDGSQPAPDPAGENPDGTSQTQRGTIPPDAQARINAVQRSAPNSSEPLLAAIQPLIDLGLSSEEAIRISFGAFPVAGAARFTHDWLFPRYGPGFRHHLGTDVFAAYGTPLRAVSEGTLRASDGGLGGLSIRVVQPDGLYFYYTHLSALPDDYVEGASVQVGDIIGYVGDSGNARGGSPHLHFGIYRGGVAIDPKPFLDQALEDAMANLPDVIARVEASLAAGDSSAVGARRPRSLLATSLLRERANVTAAGVVTTETLYQTSSNPSVGGVAVVEHEAGRLAATVDWSTRLIEPEADDVSVVAGD